MTPLLHTLARLTAKALGTLVAIVAALLQWMPGAALACTLAVGWAVWWWSGQPGSLPTAVQLARPWVAALQPLQLQAPQASLRSGGPVERLQWQQDGLRIEAQGIEVGWCLARPHGTWQGALHWHANARTVTVDDQRPTSAGAPQALDALALPLAVEGTLRTDELRLPALPRLRWTALTVAHRYDTATQRHTLTAQANGPAPYALQATLDAAPPHALKAQFSAPDQQATLQLAGSLAGDDARLTATFDLPPTHATATLYPWHTQPVGELHAELNGLNLAPLWPGLPVTHLVGQAHATPTPDAASSTLTQPWQLKVALRNDPAGPWDQQRLPVSEWTLQAQGHAQAGEVTRFSAQLAQGQATGQGQWRGPVWQASSWQGLLHLNGLRTAAAWSTWPALALNGDIQAQPQTPPAATTTPATAATPATRLTVDLQATALNQNIKNNSNKINKYEREGRIFSEILLSPTTVTLQHTRLALDGAVLTLSAQAHRPPPTATTPSPTWTLDGQGDLTLPGLNAQGQWQQLPLTGAWPETLGTQGSLRVDAPRIDAALAWLQPWWTPWQTATALSDLSGQGKLEARWQQGQWGVDLQSQWQRRGLQGELTLAIDGGWPGAQASNAAPTPHPWQGQVRQLALSLGAAQQHRQGQWTLADGGVSLQASPQGIQVGAGRLQWRDTAHPGTAPAQLNWQGLSWQDGLLSTEGELAHWGLPQLQSLMRLTRPTPATDDDPWALASGDLTLGGQWAVRWPTDGRPRPDQVLSVRLQREAGDLKWPQGTAAPEPVGLNTLVGTVQGNAQRVSAQLSADSALLGRLRAQLETDARLGADSPLAGDLTLQLPDLSQWTHLAPPGWRLQGQAQLHARLSGQLLRPLWQGELTGQQLGLRSAVEGLAYTNGTVRAQLNGQRLTLQSFSLEGAGGEARGGRLDVSGHVDWPDLSAPPDIRLEAQAHALNVSARADRRLVLSGQVQATWQAASPAVGDNLLTLRGQLKADQVQFTLPDETAPTQGSDVVVRLNHQVVTPPPSRPAWRSDVDLTLDLGPACTVQGQGLSTQLAGQLRLTRNPAQPSLRVVGEVRTVRGSYRAYGQALNISEGVLRFNGPHDDPALDILALRSAGRAFERSTESSQQVGVKITGSARQPRVQLYAQPDLLDSDKLAWLLLGRPATGVGAEAAVLQQAAMAMLAGSGPGLDGRLARTLGLDDVTLRSASTSTNGTTTDASLLLGKRLSSRLYVAYEQSLNGATSAISLFYDVSRRLTLRARAGQAQSIDLIATLPHD